MNISVIGMGYVGLTTGVSLAFIGHCVTCMDIDESKVNGLKRGVLPIQENGLHELFAGTRTNLRFTSSYAEAALQADVVLLAVGTPSREDGSPELSYLYHAVEQISAHLQTKATPTLVVVKSTVPVGTCSRIAAIVSSSGLAPLVSVASNPEFLRQGKAVSDTLYPERIVVGGQPGACEVLREMYRPLLEQRFNAPAYLPRPAGRGPVLFLASDARSAELGKYAANAYLAMKISFINEIANLCDRTGADVTRIAEIIGADSRIGPAFLQAGIGYGGSCFPKDIRALNHIADTNGYDFKLLSAVIEVNRAQKWILLDKLRSEFPDLRGRKIAVLGLTFKPGTDDLRDALSFPIIEALLGEGAVVIAHDPVALEKARGLLPQSVQLAKDAEEALREAEAALLVTEWPDYTKPGGLRFRELMKRPLVIDGRNALPFEQRRELEYRGVGIVSPEGIPV